MQDKKITDKAKLLELISDKDGRNVYESQDSLMENLFSNESVQDPHLSGERF